MLQAQNVSVFYGSHQVLKDVSLKVTAHTRLGLVGANGGGKSTLLKCLMRELTPSEGDVSQMPNVRIRCLTQNPELNPTYTLQEELYSVFTEVNDAKHEESELLKTLEHLSGAAYDKALQRIAELQDALERLGVRELDAKISRMVTGLGFALHELERPVHKFSGGWQMRINLAKVLLQGADIILMDEPTNHLDMEACQWLESFLKEYPGGILVVSHDRRFLDEVVTEIAELERGVLTLYGGNYSYYVEERERNRELQQAAADRQEKNLKTQMAFVERFRASATKSTQAKSREKQLAKIERIEAPQAELKRLNFQFPLTNPSGREVLQLNKVAKSFGEHQLFTEVSASLEWTKDAPQRVFILGANGCGKTTLFKLLMGLETPDSGTVQFGNRVELGYYAQHQLQILDPDKTVFETLEEAMPPTHQAEIRGVLGRFLFTADQVFKKVDVISGGEKGRLAMAKLMVGGPNTLLLDEPTNHLDTPAQEAVESAIRAYQGTVLCISHDRYFIQNLATQIWEFDQGRLITFEGSYNHYLEKRSLLLLQSRKSAGISPAMMKEINTNATGEVDSKQQRRQFKVLQKQLRAVEKTVDALTQEKELLQAEMSHPRVSNDYLALDRLSQQLEAVQSKLSAEESHWELLSEQVESLR
jgi:ATP-binding cassette subfamily F protein 3